MSSILFSKKFLNVSSHAFNSSGTCPFPELRIIFPTISYRKICLALSIFGAFPLFFSSLTVFKILMRSFFASELNHLSSNRFANILSVKIISVFFSVFFAISLFWSFIASVIFVRVVFASSIASLSFPLNDPSWNLMISSIKLWFLHNRFCWRLFQFSCTLLSNGSFVSYLFPIISHRSCFTSFGVVGST